MPTTPSKGATPAKKAASTSKRRNRNTTADTRVTRSATATRISEASCGPKNPPEEEEEEEPIYKPGLLFENPNTPAATSSPKAPAKRPSKPPKRSAQPTERENISAAAVSRAISMHLDHFRRYEEGKRFNYVFEVVVAQDDPPIHKIGIAKNPTVRQGQVKSRCKFARMSEVAASVKERPNNTARMIEKLAHLELRMFKCTGKCTCGTAHREYFKVSRTIALNAHQRWLDFCQNEPWGPDDRLLPFWKDRLENKPPLAADCDYEGLAASWEAFTKPTTVDWITWNIRLLLIGHFQSQFLSSFALVMAGCNAYRWLSHAFLPGFICLVGIIGGCSWADGRKSCSVWVNEAPWKQRAPPARGKKTTNDRQTPSKQRATPAKGEKTTSGPQAEAIDLTVDEEERPDAAFVANPRGHNEVAELGPEERSGGPADPYVVDSDDDEVADDSAITFVEDERVDDSVMTYLNDSEEDEEDEEEDKEEDEEMEDRDDGDEMDCDEMGHTTDVGMLAQGMGAVSLTGSSNLKAAMPALLGDSPGARLSSRPVLVQA